MTLSLWLETDRPCPKCGVRNVQYRVIDTNGHADEKYCCLNDSCGHTWRIDGDDG